MACQWWERFFRGKNSFPIVEFVMTMTIIIILAGLGSGFVIFFVDNVIFLSNRLNIDMVVFDILDIVCEGDAQAGGFRFT